MSHLDVLFAHNPPFRTPAAHIRRTANCVTAADAAAMHRGRIVCFVDSSFLDICACHECNAALENGTAIVVLLEPLTVLLKKKTREKIARLHAHLKTGGQCLLAYAGAELSDPAMLAESLFKQLCVNKVGPAATCLSALYNVRQLTWPQPLPLLPPT